MKWQYRIEVVSGDTEQAQARLNILGDSGWEVVAIWPAAQKNFGVLLKRGTAK